MTATPHPLKRTFALLERTPGALDALLRGLPPEWIDSNEGGDSWTAREIVAHLCHADSADWIAHIVEFGESRPFPTFNREERREDCKCKSMAELLDEFAALRAASLDKLRAMALCSADMERRSVHQVLGAVTLAELLNTWAAHDLTHLHQITRVMARQVREDVGPFRRFLGVMKCDSHSE
jgi:hypothetical protein